MAVATTHKFSTFMLLKWFLLEEPSAIVHRYLRYARALTEIIPLPFLVLTLFSPWKNIRERKTEHGFSLERTLERLVLNVFSRCVGAVVRLFAFVLGVIIQLLLLVFFVAYFAAWILYPVLLVYGLTYLVSTL